MGIAKLFTQTCSLRTLLANGTLGPQFAAPVTVTCFIQNARQDRRTSSSAEVIAQTVLYAGLATAATVPPLAGQFAPGSEVTVNGVISHVITSNTENQAGPASVHHVRVALA